MHAIERALKSVLDRLNEQPKRLLHWYVLGTKSTPPPDLFKQRLVKRIGKEFNLKSFVETGTYRGDMTAAAASVFDKVYSIEIFQPFYERAVARFANRPKVKILKGNSGEDLKKLLTEIKEPALFWLDAHGGKTAKQPDGSETAAPVRPELEAILNHSLRDKHVILVDDIHTFVRGTKWGVGVWTQVEELREKWLAAHPDWLWKVQDNVLHIYKKRDGVAS